MLSPGMAKRWTRLSDSTTAASVKMENRLILWKKTKRGGELVSAVDRGKSGSFHRVGGALSLTLTSASIAQRLGICLCLFFCEYSHF